MLHIQPNPDLTDQRIDQYRLLKYLGTGGSGVVYLAENLLNNTQVALKILHTPLKPETIAAFFTEAKVFLLEHPHIVRVKNFGHYNNRPYFVMPYLPFGDLRTLYPRGKRLAWNVVHPYITQIIDALQYIHAEGIVHRDIKPENMLLADQNTILLSDFGISVTSYTINIEKQVAKGTVYYMAPEQIEGQAVRASDQYSLGAVIYELLTGQPPFVGDTAESILNQHLHTDVKAPRKIEPSIPPLIEDLVLKMLKKNPAERFASMNELLVEVKRISQGISTTTSAPSKRATHFTGHADAVQTLAWSPNGKYIASAGHDKIVHVWDTITGHIIYSYHGHTKSLWSVAWSPDSCSLMSAGSDETVQIWEATTGCPLTSHTEHRGTIRAVAWHPSGLQVASGSDDKVVKVWHTASSAVTYSYEGHNETIYCLTWSPDGTYLVSGDNKGVIRIWKATNGEYVRAYHRHTDRVTSISWSPDGMYIASASDDCTIHIWETQSGKLLQTCTGHTNTVSAVAWSPDGRYLVSGSWDHTVRLWEWNTQTQSAQCLHTYEGHKQWVNTVAWSPDGNYFASGSWDNAVHISSRAALCP